MEKTVYFLISHNEFAKGLKKALEMIAGEQSNVYAFGLMPGDHPDNIVKKMEHCMTDDIDHVVILGDLAGGSVCNAALKLTVNPKVTLIAGVNLPLAMEIIIAKANTPATISPILEQAKNEMKMITVQQLKAETMEDFF
ncbi:PTS sugar transporter subunit IIA [Enterococcus camelliae]|uniref:PTS sugar transporter subunit IIA n=1 Tax=Enterococcus camelliae TaxID=453959 RepID=A0ABW5THJ2_9ENTE